MSKETQIIKLKEPERFDLMNTIANEILLSTTKNHFHMAALKANAIAQLKKILTDELVKGIKDSLENTRLGYMTDSKEGYNIETTRLCLIEAALDGQYWHGNEFNIIAGNKYITKEGFIGRMSRNPDFTDVKIQLGLPIWNESDKKAVVKFKASWKYQSHSDNLEDEIPIKLQYTKTGYCVTTDDAIFGKANRKIRARIWEQATGNYLADGDIEELTEEQFEIVNENNQEQIADIVQESIAIQKPVQSIQPEAKEPPRQKDTAQEAEIRKQAIADLNKSDDDIFNEMKNSQK